MRRMPKSRIIYGKDAEKSNVKVAGAIFYATDTTKLYVSDGTGMDLVSTATGDMLTATYDPTAVAGDAFDMDNMVEGTSLILTAAERAAIITNTAKVGVDTGVVEISHLSATGSPGATNYLRGDGAWVVPAGAGDVSKVGTPVNNELGVWTGDGTLEGEANLTYDGSNLLISAGDLGATGTRITKGWFTDLEVTNAIAGDITGNAATVTTITGLAPDTATTAAAQANITSLGTLTALDVDDININGNTISSSGASSLAITPTAGQAILLDGTISVDAGVVTGATSITSTSFVGDLTGNADTVTTNANLTGGVTSVGNAATVVTNANLTGDVTSVGNATTIAADAVTYTKMQNVASDQVLLGNIAGINEAVAELTATQVTAMLDAATDSLPGVVELATIAETNTGTDATRAVTPDGLDGWTGSAQVVTLGTIATGTWQGDVVAEAYLPDASTSAEGVVELATVAEADTGTDAARVMSVDVMAGSDFGTKEMTVNIYDIGTDVDTTAGLRSVTIPPSLDGWNVVDMVVSVHTLGTSTGAETITSNLTRRRAGADASCFSTPVSLDKTEYFAADGVVDAANDDMLTGDMLMPTIANSLDTTDATGCSVTIMFRKP